MPRDLPTATETAPPQPVRTATGPGERADAKAAALDGAAAPEHDHASPEQQQVGPKLTVLDGLGGPVDQHAADRDTEGLRADVDSPPTGSSVSRPDDAGWIPEIPPADSAGNTAPPMVSEAAEPDAQPEVPETQDAAQDSRPVLDGRLAEIYDASVRTPAGRAYFDVGDPIIRSALRAEPKTGHFSADLHGSPDGFVVGKEHLDARDPARLVRADPRWDNQPVRLISRETGKGPTPVAQELADELGVPVVAPTELAFVNRKTGAVYSTEVRVDAKGNLKPVVPFNGAWVTFQPEGSERRE